MFEEVKKFNENAEKIIEAIRDFNIMAGGLLGYKVTYKEDKKWRHNERLSKDTCE